MNKISAYVSVLVFSVLVSCQLMIEVDMPPQKARLVVSAIFSTAEEMKVYVSKSCDILDTIRYGGCFVLSPLVTPIVTVTDDLGNVITLTPKSGGGFFGQYHAPIKPAPGQTYVIDVSANGFESVRATARIPDLVKDVEVLVDSTGLNPNGNNSNVPITVRFSEQNGLVNYYIVLLHQKVTFHYTDPVTNRTYDGSSMRDYTLFYKRTGPGSADGEAVFSETFCNDNLCEVKSLVSTDNYFKPNSSLEENYIEVINLGEEFFDYYSTSDLQGKTQGDPFAQPVLVYNNIQNGFGIFAGFSRTRFDLR